MCSHVVNASQSAPPSLADAMHQQRDLGKVAGAPAPVDLVVRESEAGREALQQAVAYAEDQQSYALLVWQKGELVLERYFGDYDRELRAESASMHKSVLALVVVAALSDGYIVSVDDPVGRYIPEWKNDARGAITIRHLLTMSSGLRSLSSAGGRQSQSRRFLTGDIDARQTILSLELVEKPGRVFRYQNTVSQLLGLIVESATGQAYEKYLSERLWQPMGLGDAYVWYNEPGGFPKTYSALLARAQDWLKIGLLVKDKGRFNGKQLLPTDLMNMMTAPSAANPCYGWQIWIGRDQLKGRFYNPNNTGLSVAQSEAFTLDDWVYFDGFGGQRVYISEASDLVIVRTGDIRMDWDESALPNIVSAHAVASPRRRADVVTLTAAGGREVEVRVVRPNRGCNPCKAIVFSHGANLGFDQYDVLFSAWADAGYVVLAPLHVDSEQYLAPGRYSQTQALPLRVEDMQRVVAAMFDEPHRLLKGSVFSKQYVAAGHSYGALIAQLMAGAKLDQPVADPRPLIDPVGVIALSPPGPVEGFLSASSWQTIAPPQMVVTGTSDVVPLVAPEWRDHLAAFNAGRTGASYGLVFGDMDHYFNGAFGRLGEPSVASQRAIHALNRRILYFADTLIKGHRISQQQWRSLGSAEIEALAR